MILISVECCALRWSDMPVNHRKQLQLVTESRDASIELVIGTV